MDRSSKSWVHFNGFWWAMCKNFRSIINEYQKKQTWLFCLEYPHSKAGSNVGTWSDAINQHESIIRRQCKQPEIQECWPWPLFSRDRVVDAAGVADASLKGGGTSAIFTPWMWYTYCSHNCGWFWWAMLFTNVRKVLTQCQTRTQPPDCPSYLLYRLWTCALRILIRVECTTHKNKHRIRPWNGDRNTGKLKPTQLCKNTCSRRCFSWHTK